MPPVRGNDSVNIFSLVRQDASSQIQGNRPDRTLDSSEWTTKILEIPSFNSDREKPRNTDTGCILSKKISDTQTKTCWFYPDWSPRFCGTFWYSLEFGICCISGNSEEPGPTLWIDQYSEKFILSQWETLVSHSRVRHHRLRRIFQSQNPRLWEISGGQWLDLFERIKLWKWG